MYRSFLKHWQDENIIPNGLYITLEPSIKNYDDGFNTEWYKRLNSFSLTSMEDLIRFCDFCDQTVKKVTSEVSVTESQLNKKLRHEERQSIYKVLDRNDESNRKFLQQK